nr:immunoglobulin heavy chain junction region [Macaca mulatta]
CACYVDDYGYYHTEDILDSW